MPLFWNDAIVVSLYVLSEGVWLTGVEPLVGPHDGHQVFGVAEVDDVVGIPWQHVHRLDVVSIHLKFQNLIRADFPLLNQAVAADHHEKLPLGVVPVLALGDSRLGDVHGNLAAVSGFQQFGKAAPDVCVHLQGKGHLFLGQVGQVGGVELFCETVRGNLWQHQRFRLGLEGLQQLHNLPQGHLVGGRSVAVFPILFQEGHQPVVVAAVGTALQGVQHLLHQVVDVEQLQLGVGVVDLDGQVVGDVITERGHHAVVVGAAPFAEQVGEPVQQHGSTGLLAVSEEKLLSRQLGAAVVGFPVPADKRGLDGAGQQNGALVPRLFQGIQERGGKAEVSFHELLVVLGPVHPGKMEHKIRPGTVPGKQRRVYVQVVGVDLVDVQIGAGAVFPLGDVFQVGHQVLSHKALGAGDEDVHGVSSFAETTEPSGMTASAGTWALLLMVTVLPIFARFPTVA